MNKLEGVMQEANDAKESASNDEIELRRREVLARLGRFTGYVAPVTVAMLSMKANAAS